MSAPAGIAESKHYVSRLVTLVWLSLAQLVRTPSHSRRAEAGRRAARHILMLAAGFGLAIVVLMYALDTWEIAQMPKRGAPSLWWARILTDFGKDEYVLGTLAALLVVIAIAAPAMRGIQRSLLLGLGTRLQFIFFAVLFPVLVGEVIKWVVGRGRPFVGSDVFHFSHFDGSGAYSSFPSGHSTTAWALAFAVAAVWPRTRGPMIVYAVIIIATRLVLLAHHPSDVVAGALLGIIGAMCVRYWFAARKLGFAIHHDGKIVSLVGPSSGRLKRVAGGAFAP